MGNTVTGYLCFSQTNTMKRKEFERLLPYWRAKQQQQQHAPTVTTRRHNKRVANGSGIVLKNSSIKHQVHIETVFQSEPVQRHNRILASLPCIVTTRKEQNEQRKRNERLGNE